MKRTKKGKTIYYTIDFNERIKSIKVYYINLDTLRLFVELECLLNSPYSNEEEIQMYLDENGYGDDEYNFEKI